MRLSIFSRYADVALSWNQNPCLTSDHLLVGVLFSSRYYMLDAFRSRIQQCFHRTNQFKYEPRYSLQVLICTYICQSCIQLKSWKRTDQCSISKVRCILRKGTVTLQKLCQEQYHEQIRHSVACQLFRQCAHETGDTNLVVEGKEFSSPRNNENQRHSKFSTYNVILLRALSNAVASRVTCAPLLPGAVP